MRSSLVADEIDDGKLARCFTETVASDLQYHVVVPKGAPLRPPVEAFRNWILAESARVA